MGANLNRIWVTLAKLRNSIASPTLDTPNRLSFPDPLPPPASAVIYNTRNMRSNRDTSGDGTSIYISQSAQMIPVVAALIEAAIHTDAIREELDRGRKEEKDLVRDVKEYCRKENERLKDNAKAKGQSREVKVEEEVHKRNLQHLENAMKLILPKFSPRFSPLGTDNEGRIFWALSSSISERNAAFDFITSVTTGSSESARKNIRSRAKSQGQAMNDEERGAMKWWSSFVAVWGKKPPIARNPSKTKMAREISGHDAETGGCDSDDEVVEKWWGFHEPDEIRKVADWIAIETGLGLEDGSQNGSASTLVKGLQEYAALLEWRLSENRFEHGNANFVVSK